MKKFFYSFVATLLLTLLAVQHSQAATTWSITSDYITYSEGRIVTFTITRSGDTSVPDTISYRTVSLTAFDGQQFQGVSGMFIFPAGTTTKTVDVKEKFIGYYDYAYWYQTGDYFYYRFEVLNMQGTRKAYLDRSLSVGSYKLNSYYNFHNFANFYKVRSTWIAPDGHSGSNDLIITDEGYAQNYSVFTSEDIYTQQNWFKQYFLASKAEVRMTVDFQAKETNDGYQHIQILIDTLGYDQGDPESINIARYMAKFEHGSGEKNTEYAKYVFPVASANDNESAELPWTDVNNNVGSLTLQRFNTGCRAEDGRLLIPANFRYGIVRYDASGNNEDDWNIKESYVKLQIVDLYAPELLDIKVSQDAFRTGNELFVSFAFNEVVYTDDNPVLYTSWGTLPYLIGKGTNVLTFSGKITDGVAGSHLVIDSMSSPVRDILEHEMTLPSQTIHSAVRTGEPTSPAGIPVQFVDRYGYEIVSAVLPIEAPEPPIVTGKVFNGWEATVADDLEQNGITLKATYVSNLPTNANIPTAENTARKRLTDGNIFIDNNEHTYTIDGREVK